MGINLRHADLLCPGSHFVDVRVDESGEIRWLLERRDAVSKWLGMEVRLLLKDRGSNIQNFCAGCVGLKSDSCCRTGGY